MFASLRQAAREAGATEHPTCDCGEQIPVKHWAVHRATCPAVQSKLEPPKPAA